MGLKVVIRRKSVTGKRSGKSIVVLDRSDTGVTPLEVLNDDVGLILVVYVS